MNHNNKTTIAQKSIFPRYIETENQLLSTNFDDVKKELPDLSDQELIDLVVKSLKGRKDYMSIISKIIYEINDN